MEGEGLFVSLSARHGYFLVLETTLLILIEKATIQGLGSRLGDVIGLKVHLNVLVLLLLLLIGLIFEPRTTDGLLSRSVASAHAKGIWDCDVVLAFSTFRHHILLVHQLLFKCSLQAPLDLFGIFVLKSCRLSPCSVNICDTEPAEGHHLTRAQLATLGEIDYEFLPSDTLLFVLLANS